MMRKTGSQILGDIYRLLRDSDLSRSLTGGVYRAGYRPQDSRKEDAVVTLTAGLPWQIQEGVVTVNIFVPDIVPFDNGVPVEDGRRTAEIEAMAQQWVERQLTAKSGNYLLRLQETIRTYEDPDICQHFVAVKLRYRLFE